MCQICEKETVILERDFISEGSWGWGDISITLNQVIEDTFGLFIDKRDNTTFLRFANLEDCQCLESGEKVEISFCPFCGRKL